ncbi:MAG: type IV pilus assembly protein PilM [Patescibacteria group bacterium]
MFGSLFRRSHSNKFVGVDIGSSSIKVVQLSRQKGVISLDTFGEIALGPYAGKEIGHSVRLDTPQYAEALRDLLRESQVDARTAGLSIPLKSSLVFNMKMPKMSDSKLDEMVRLEARRYIPVSVSEVSLDWSIIPNLNNDGEKDNFQTIMVVAIHKDTLNKFKEIADQAKLDLQFLEIETFSTIRSVLRHENNSSAIIDIGASITKIYIIEYGIVQKSQVIPVGSQNMIKSLETQRKLSAIGEDLNIAQAEELQRQIEESQRIPVDLDRILTEVKKIILSYQKSNRKNIEEVILTGGGSILKGVMPYVVESLETEVSIAHPFNKVDTPAFLEDTLRDAGPEFSVAIGLGMRGLDS